MTLACEFQPCGSGEEEEKREERGKRKGGREERGGERRRERRGRVGGKKKERDEERGGTQGRGRRHEVEKEEGQIKKQKEIGKEGEGKEAGEEKKGERRERENIGIMKYACIRVNITQTAVLREQGRTVSHTFMSLTFLGKSLLLTTWVLSLIHCFVASYSCW